jgi:hypothetical protein
VTEVGRNKRRVVSWLLLVVGVALTALSFVRLVEVDNRAAQASPWWWIGLTGAAVTVVALGSPWSERRARDDPS